MATKAVLDSSFLIDAPRFRINILEELSRCMIQRVEPIILSVTLSELVSMAEGRSAKSSKEASLALAAARDFPVMEVKRKPDEEVDDVILRIAVERQWSVATNDRVLRRKLKDNNVPTIFVRQRSHLESR